MGAIDVTLRSERREDHAPIADVHRVAFGRDNEARLVEAIRRAAGFDPALSIVAERDTHDARPAIIGHVLFSPVDIDTNAGSTPALALAPMAVRPEHQETGRRVVAGVAGLEACRARGHAVVIVLGHPTWYPSFGFEPAGKYGIECPFPVPPGVFLVRPLHPTALDGVSGHVRYPACFLAV
jgi:putative acetyltransferase